MNIRATISVINVLLILGAVSSLQAAWVNATGDLAGKASECGTVQCSPWAIPNSNVVIAGISNNGLYSTTDGGTTWKLLSSAILARPKQLIVDPEHPSTWWYCGIYHTPSVFKTTDAGATWTGFTGGVSHNDGMAVDFSDPQRRIILAGGHEQIKTLWKTTDGGTAWTNIGGGIGAGNSCFPYILDSQTYLIGLRTGSGGIQRSTDAGSTWTTVSTVAPRTYITKGSDGTLYYTAENNSIMKGSADGTTWSVVAGVQGYASPVLILPDDKIAVASRSSGIAISGDRGATWKTVAGPLPTAFTGNSSAGVNASLTYNAVAGSFFLATMNCVTTITSNEIWRYDTLIGSGTGTVRPGSLSAKAIATIARSSMSRFAVDISGRRISDNGVRSSSGTIRLRFEEGADGIVRRLVSVR